MNSKKQTKNMKSLFPEDCLITEILHKIADSAEKQKTEIYLVGGAVRDKIMNRDTTDVDVTVLGNGIEFADKLAKHIGAPKVIKYPKFGTAMVPYRGYVLEFASARSEEYKENSRKPIVSKGTLKDDLLRRDFTINSLAMSLNNNSFFDLIDEFQGIEDIEAKIIKTPLDPIITFSEDPLRMLRAIRFATQLDFKIEKETFEAIEKVKDRIKIISQERITEELKKMMMTDKRPSIGFELLRKCGLLKIILPEIARLEGVDQVSKYHHKDVFWHTLEVLDNVAKYSDDFLLRFTALVHDIGKPDTKRFVHGKGWTFYGHEVVGLRLIDNFCKRMKLPNKLRDYAKKLTSLHLRPIALADEGVTDSAVRRLMVLADEYLDDLMLLCRADITSKNPQKVNKYYTNFTRVEEYVLKVEERDKMRAFQSPVRGDEIMSFFNLSPGPDIGFIKKALEESILNCEVENDYDSVKKYMVDKKEFFLQELKKNK